jgi:dTDP-4-dehydrorhamnose reductase
MKILLFGGSGQLGHEIIKRGRDLNFEVLYPVSSEADISDRGQVFRLIKTIKPDLVINSAAYTAVDKAETEVDAAFAINEVGAGYVAEAVKTIGARLIHISTDYVFGDGFSAPITEDAETSPLNVYGQSKLAGEKRVLEETEGSALILRISSLHGKKGVNFVHTMLQLFAEQPEVKVVNDITMSTTYAGWLAEVILDLGRVPASGVVHACCSGAISWFDFASEILELSKAKLENARELKLTPVKAEAFPRPARRAHYSVLDTTRLENLLGRKPISWKDGLRAHLRELDFVV